MNRLNQIFLNWRALVLRNIGYISFAKVSLTTHLTIVCRSELWQLSFKSMKYVAVADIGYFLKGVTDVV